MDADETGTAEVYSFNPVTNEWTKLPDLKVQRSFQGVAAYNEYVYSIGGMNSALGDLKHAEKLNILTVSDMLVHVYLSFVEVYLSQYSNVDPKLFCIGLFSGASLIRTD